MNLSFKTTASSLILAATLLAAPIAAQSQGIGQGAADGARAGDHAAGPVGGAVGAVVGGVTGGVKGLLGADQRPRFHEYVVHQHARSYAYDQPVIVGSTLPPDGVTYYDVPPEYGVQDYRYRQ